MIEEEKTLDGLEKVSTDKHYTTAADQKPQGPSLSEDHTKKTSVPWNAWIILFISCCGVFMARVSTSALIIAFPEILLILQTLIKATLNEATQHIV